MTKSKSAAPSIIVPSTFPIDLVNGARVLNDSVSGAAVTGISPD